MNFIKAIFQNKIDENVHAKFVRFGIGKYEKRAIINFASNEKVKLTTSFEFANDIILFFASLVKEFYVKGILLTRENQQQLLEKLGIKAEIKKAGNIYKNKIDAKLKKEIIEEISKVAYFMLFDCFSEGIELKTKKKLPSMKIGKSGEIKFDEKFCVLQMEKNFLPALKEEFLFDLPECKKAKIWHDFFINEIILPEEEDPEMLRTKAKRKGKIVRILQYNNKQKTREKEFLA